MNGIEKIKGRILSDAQAEIEKMEQQAQAQVHEIAETYRQEAEQISAEAKAKTDKAAREREERLVSLAQMESRKAILAARQAQVEAAFDQALETLCNLDKKQAAEVAANLLVLAAEDGKGEVIFSPSDREAFGKAAVKAANKRIKNGSLTLSDTTREIKGGFILSSGNVEVNCTFDTLIRLEKGEMAREVNRILFPGE
jgi:V/A-type H+-transporting ATPase subunit E